jgi:hypothetical protein
MPTFRRLGLAGAALLLLAATPTRAHAAFVFTLTQVGGNVVVNGSGTLNTTALTLSSSSNTFAQITSSHAILFAGPTNFVACSVDVGGGLSGPTSFGNGSGIASSGTGDLVGIDGFDGSIWVPQGYISGTLLTDSTTFAGTFASIGFSSGTYTYTWGMGTNADSLTVTSIVPEPSTWALLGVGLGALGLTLRHRSARR